MNNPFQFNAEQGCLLVQGELTIYQATEALLAFRQALDCGLLTEVDLSQVTELDCAGVQLLLALKKSAPEVKLVQHSPAVSGVVTLTSLTAQLDADHLAGVA